MTMKRSFALLAIFAMLFAVPMQAQEVVPTGFNIDTLATGLSNPTDFTFLPDGRVLITRQSPGQVRLWVPGSTSTTVIGTVPNLTSGSERGLLSIALDPNFTTNGYIYLYWSRSAPTAMELARFTCTGDLNNPTSTNLSFATASRRTLIQAPDAAFNHNGGTARFGLDGMLYLTNGDDAVNPCNAQNNTRYEGKVFRMDVSGLPAGGGTATGAQLDPGDNPFSGSTSTPQRLMIAKGLRNPFSMNVDPLTGDLFIADVGLGTREEYNQYVRGTGNPTFVNFGWPMREGFVGGPQSGCAPQTGLTNPIDDRLYSQGNASIMSAGMYRNLGGNLDWGSAYEGNCFHNDYFAGTIERLVFNGSTWANAAPVLGQPNPNFWGTGFQGCTHFRTGPDGSVYFVDNNSGGAFKRIRIDAPSDEFMALSGTGQVGAQGSQFKQPIVLELRDPGGVLVPGANVTLTTNAAGAIVGPTTLTTDANGQISFLLEAVGAGEIAVTASTPSGTILGETFTCFARGLAMNVVQLPTQDIIVTNFINITNSGGNVPFLFAMTADVQPIYPTIYGDLCVDLFTLNNTVIIEDPQGLFTGVQYAGGIWVKPAASNFGSDTNIYQVPPGLLFGTLRFQAIFADPSVTTSIAGTTDSIFGFTNCVTEIF